MRIGSQVVFACVLLTSASAPALAQSTVFASPPIPLGYGEGASNATCYFSNVSGATTRIRNVRIYTPGDVQTLTANTCGDPASFNLAPQSRCYIGAAVSGGMTVGCASLASSPGALRATVEVRQSDGRVLERAQLGPGTGAAADQFQRLASSSAYGSPEQQYVSCRVTNLGGPSVRLKARQIVDATGAVVPLTSDSCGAQAETTLQSGASCGFSASARAPLSDRQCRLQVTRKANVRATMSFGATLAVYSWTPMD